jgi:hypothetical protein
MRGGGVMRTHDFWNLNAFLDTAVRMKTLSGRSAAFIAYGFADVL